MMNPKFADRIARRITVVKRTKGQAAAAHEGTGRSRGAGD
jgi:hypothetical protein